MRICFNMDYFKKIKRIEKIGLSPVKETPILIKTKDNLFVLATIFK